MGYSRRAGKTAISVFVAGLSAAGLLAPIQANAKTYDGYVDYDPGDGAFIFMDEFPSLGRLDRVRIEGHFHDFEFKNNQDVNHTFTGPIDDSVSFIFGSLPAFQTGFPAEVSMGPTHQVFEGLGYVKAVGQTSFLVDTDVSFSFESSLFASADFMGLTTPYDLSGFYGDGSQSLPLDVEVSGSPSYNPDQRWYQFDGTVHYDYDLTPEEMGFLAVPEPASWALMIVGLGVVGVGLRSRERRLATA